jgi:capsular polysaccharide biosynthesis protein
MAPQRTVDRFRRHWRELPRVGVERGLPPSWFGYRWIRKETVPEYFRRKGKDESAGRYEVLQPEKTEENPLPGNFGARDELPKDRGWWGYSFWDVPSRLSGETFRATVPDCRVVPWVDGSTGNFWVGIVNADERAFILREFHFRGGHARVLRSSDAPVKLSRATWVAERVYHNYSHWLTAHLPKLLLLAARGGLDEVLLPPDRPEFIDRSMQLVGLEPGTFATFDPSRPLEVAELTLLGTDRFRPELLRMVGDATPSLTSERPSRRVFISRAGAARRRLVNEEELWPLLQGAGFERVSMEELGFEEQVRLMQETAVLVAPHGAGLTNMLFCAPGTHIVEIASLGFPNPNFYALASAMKHRYWLLPADALGDEHPLERDLRVDAGAVESLLAQVVG